MQVPNNLGLEYRLNIGYRLGQNIGCRLGYTDMKYRISAECKYRISDKISRNAIPIEKTGEKLPNLLDPQLAQLMISPYKG